MEFEEYMLRRYGSRAFYEKYTSKEDLVADLAYYGLPSTLANLSSAHKTEDGYYKRDYREWSIIGYPKEM